MKSSSGVPAALLAAAVLPVATASAATLAFSPDGITCEEPPGACGNGLRINQSVGDIAGQLDVVYGNRVGPGDSPQFTTNLSGIRWFDAGYGDLAGVLWGRGDDGVAEIALLPADGYTVRLTGFDLGSFYADTPTQFTVYDGNYTPLASSGELVLDAFGGAGRIHYHYDFDLQSASGIIVQWGPDSSSVALDNLGFELAPVPVPATLPLFAAGLAALARWTRPRR